MGKTPTLVYQKLKVTGLIAEYKTYSKPLMINFEQPRAKVKTVKKKEKNINDSIRRAKTRIKDLVNTNVDLNKFITLTYEDNFTDYNLAYSHLRQFIRALCRFNNGKIKYIAVMEKQARGAIHFHILSNTKFVPVVIMRGFWQYRGFVFVVNTKRINDLGFYLSKYFTKDEHIPNRKKYSISEHLNQPIILYNELATETFNKFYEISNEIYITKYWTWYMGDVELVVIRNTQDFIFNYLITNIIDRPGRSGVRGPNPEL